MTDSPIDPILEAARAVFRSRGYAATTLQAVAVAANVAPGVVTSLYRNREALLQAALDLPYDPAAAIPRVIAPGLDGMGERVVRLALVVIDDRDVVRDGTTLAGTTLAGSTGGSLPSLLGTAERVLALVDALSSGVGDAIAAAMGIPDARMRGALVSSTIVGLAMARAVLRIEPLASATHDEVVAVVAPTVQRLLDPTIPLGS